MRGLYGGVEAAGMMVLDGEKGNEEKAIVMTAEGSGAHTMGQQVISVEGAPDLYPDQWVLMQVTEYKHYAPVAGVVLAAGSDEHVQAVLMDRIHSGCPDPPYYRFFAFKYKHLDPEWCETWDQVMTELMIEELAIDDERG